MRVRHVAISVRTGAMPTSESSESGLESGLDWYTPADFNGNLILGDAGKKLNPAVVASGGAKVFPAGSILVVGIGATLGKVGLTDRIASANQKINAHILPVSSTATRRYRNVKARLQAQGGVASLAKAACLGNPCCAADGRGCVRESHQQGDWAGLGAGSVRASVFAR